MGALQLLKLALLEVVNSIDAGNSEISEEKCMEALDYLAAITDSREKISKYQACSILKISRATFDSRVAEGSIPKGMHQQGFKEVFWYKKDIEKIKALEDKKRKNK